MVTTALMHYGCDSTLASKRMEPALLLLPEAILERILIALGRKGELRYVCKAFSCAISKSAQILKVPRDILRNRDSSLVRALLSFPNAGRLILDFSRGTRLQLGGGDEDLREALEDDAGLVAGALDALAARRHPLTSLVVRHLTAPLSQPSATTLAYLNSCGLTELELYDDSIQRAASDGASNLLRPVRGQLRDCSLADSIRARGAAMARFASSLPGLQRLSLCCAAFSSADIASLAALTQLESLTVVGAMECSCPSSSTPSCTEAAAARGPRPGSLGASLSAVSSYRALLSSLPRLRRLQLPMAIAAPVGRKHVDFLDSEDEDSDSDHDEPRTYGTPNYASPTSIRNPSGGVGRLGSAQIGRAASGASAGSRVQSGQREYVNIARSSGESAAVDEVPAGDGGWRFPSQLEELTLPLCSLNGPVFRAACDVYGRKGASPSGASTAEAEVKTATGGGLRTLHVSCAPGYTVWEGSFLKDEADFACLSRLTSLESLHLTLELGGSGRGALRRDRLRDCLRHLRDIRGLEELHIAETCQPVCFAMRKNTGGNPDLLPYLLDETSFGPLRLCGEMHLPVVPRMGGFPSPSGTVMPNTGRTLLAVAAMSPAAFNVGPPPVLSSGPALDSLLVHWPKLHTLVVGRQRAHRCCRDGETRLLMPESLDELMALRKYAHFRP